MERLDFLKKGVSFLGMAVLAPAVLTPAEANACTVAATETAGPFPTLNPTSLVRSNIVSTRTGIPFTININVKNINNSCSPLVGVIVDIWHCDKDGNYSEYGGSGMQATDYTAQDFLRGRQTTDSSGVVTFTSIFPGWYTSRATHIHVHIYTADGTSLAITQIAFPEGTGSAVETVNASTAYGYTKGMTGYTYNASDNVFSDGTSTEMSSVTGDVSSGYVLSWDAYVSAPATTGISDVTGESFFQIRQNYPNPCSVDTRIPLTLRTQSDVKVSVMTTDGREIMKQYIGSLSAGEQIIDLDTASLAAGNYIYSVKVSNLSGTFRQSRLFTKR
jgi:protocatechuate 3,4-dioxygenase beta subunit